MGQLLKNNIDKCLIEFFHVDSRLVCIAKLMLIFQGIKELTNQLNMRFYHFSQGKIVYHLILKFMLFW